MRYEVGINIVCDQLKIKCLNNQFGRYQKLNTNTVEHHSYNLIVRWCALQIFRESYEIGQNW